MHRLMAGLVFVALLDSFVTLYQAFYLGTSADGFFANRNNNAAYIYIHFLPLLSVVILSEMDAKRKTIIYAVSSIFILSIFQVSSRGAYISLLIAMGILFAYAAHLRKFKNLLIAGSFIALVVLANSQITSVELKTEVSSHSRWLLWLGAINMLEEAPWYGIGNGMFHWLYPQYMSPDEKSLGLFVHNDYLQMLLELGILGVTLFVSMLTIVFLKSREMIMTHAGNENSQIYFGMTLAILATSIHSLVTFNFYIVVILLVLGLYVGFIIRYMRDAQSFNVNGCVFNISTRSRFFVVILMTLITIPLLLKGYADGVLDDFLNKDLANGTIQERYEIYGRLRELDPTRYIYPMSIAWLGMVKSSKSSHSERVVMYDTSKGMIAEAKSLNPFAPDVYLVEAQILIGFSDLDKNNFLKNAISSLRKALSLNPKFKPARVMLADRLEASGQPKAALTVIIDGLPYIHGYGHQKYYTRGSSLAHKLGDTHSYNRFEELLAREKENDQREFNEMIDEYNNTQTKI